MSSFRYRSALCDKHEASASDMNVDVDRRPSRCSGPGRVSRNLTNLPEADHHSRSSRRIASCAAVSALSCSQRQPPRLNTPSQTSEDARYRSPMDAIDSLRFHTLASCHLCFHRWLTCRALHQLDTAIFQPEIGCPTQDPLASELQQPQRWTSAPEDRRRG